MPLGQRLGSCAWLLGGEERIGERRRGKDRRGEESRKMKCEHREQRKVGTKIGKNDGEKSARHWKKGEKRVVAK